MWWKSYNTSLATSTQHLHHTLGLLHSMNLLQSAHLQLIQILLRQFLLILIRMLQFLISLHRTANVFAEFPIFFSPKTIIQLPANWTIPTMLLKLQPTMMLKLIWWTLRLIAFIALTHLRTTIPTVRIQLFLLSLMWFIG